MGAHCRTEPSLRPFLMFASAHGRHGGESYSRRLVFAAACLDILAFGITATALGSLLPSLIARFGLDNAAAGSLFPILNLAVLGGSLVFGPVVDRYGYRILLAVCVALVILGLGGIASARSLALLAPALACVGFGGGAVNGATSALVADVSDEGATALGLSILGVFFGIGAFGMPLLLGLLLRRFSYGAVTAAIGMTLLLPLLFGLAIRYPPPKQAQGFPIRRGLALLRDPALVLLGLCLFFESGMEATTGGWTATYVQGDLGVRPDRALFFVSAFWAGMLLGRIVFGTLGRRLSAATALYATFGVAFCAALGMLGGRTPLLVGAASALLGLGFAAVFPLVLAFGGTRYPALSGSVFGMLFAMGMVGGISFPWLMGILGDVVGLRASFLLVPISLVGEALVFTAARRALARRPADPASAPGSHVAAL